MSPHNFKDKSPLMAIDRSTKFQSIKIFFHWWKAWSYLLFDSKNILDNRTKSKQKHKEKKDQGLQFIPWSCCCNGIYCFKNPMKCWISSNGHISSAEIIVNWANLKMKYCSTIMNWKMTLCNMKIILKM